MRRRFLHLKKAAIVFQKQLRGQLARRVYRQMLAEKRKQEERKKREEEEKKKREEEERCSAFTV
jgi:myosin X